MVVVVVVVVVVVSPPAAVDPPFTDLDDTRLTFLTAVDMMLLLGAGDRHD